MDTLTAQKKLIANPDRVYEDPSLHSPARLASAIFIIGTDQFTLDKLSRDLIQNGYAITSSDDVERAREIMRTQPFDLILLDAGMEGVDCFDLCQQLRKKDASKDIPVVFLGGCDDPPTRLKAFECGAVDYLVKPVHMEELNLRLQTQISLHKHQVELQNKNKELKSALKKEQRLRKRTETVLKVRIRQQESAAAISRMILTVEEFDDLLRKILQNVSETLSADSCTILQLLPDNTLLLRAGYGWLFGEVNKLSIRIDQDSPIGLTVRRQEPVIFYDLSKDKRFKHLKLIMKDHGVASGVSVVIAGQNGLWGTLSVHSRVRKHFSDNDVKYLQVVAKILVDSIEYISNHEHLQQSEEKFRGLLESAPDGMLISNSEGQITMLNAALEKLTGFERDELIGKKVEVLVPARFNRHTDLRDVYIKHPRPRSVHERTDDLYIRHKNGREIPVEISLNPLMTDEGMIISANIHDITERKQAFETLKYNEELLLSYFNSGLIGMTISKPDGAGWLQINDTFCRMLGYTREELMEKKWTDITHPDDVDKDVRSQHAALMAGEIDNYTKDKRFIRKDRSILYASISVTCKRNDDGSHKYNIVIINDITDRKQAEDALRRSERQLQEAQHLAHVGFWEWDLVLDKLYWSDELYLITGLDPETFELNSNSVMGIIHPDDRQSYHDFFTRVKQEGKITDFEQRIVLSSGEVRYHQVQAELVRFPDGKPMRILGTVIDVSERRRAEDALRKNKQRLKEAQKIARLGYWERNLVTGESFWSDETFEIFGLNPNATRSSDWQIIDIVHPEDKQAVQEVVDLNTSGKNTLSHDYRIVRPDGEVRHIYTVGGAENNEDGEPVRVYATFMDITEQKQAQEALARSEERLRRFFDAGLVGMTVASLENGLIQFNDKFCDITGYSSEELEHMKWMDVTHPDDREEERNRFKRALHGEVEGFTRNKRYVRKNGEIIHAMVSTECVRKSDGEVDYFVSFVQDITDMKRAEDALQQAHDELELRVEERTTELVASKERAEIASAISKITLDSMDQGLIMVDKNNRILIYNDKLVEYSGFERERVMACRSYDEYMLLGRKKMGEEAYERILKLAQARENISYEITVGGGRTLEVRQNPLQGGGFVRTYTDITRIKEIQEDLRQAKEKAELATVAKANFLATMSHEIRTPMNGIIGMADLLQQTALDNDQKEMLETINDCGHSLLSIINDILDYSKIEANRLDLEYIPVSLEDIIEGSARTIVNGAMRKDLRLLTYVDPALPQYVIGDPVRLRQILINLGGNAIKFTDKGKIIMRADRVTADDQDNITIRFSVIDEGIGIPFYKQKKLFKEFSQVESYTTRRYGGTGLGLSICQRLVEKMDGEIGVHSNTGQGSEFYFTVSFKQCDEVKQYSNVSDLNGLRILLIIPEPVEAEIYKSYLLHWHAEVGVSSDINECVDLCLTAAADGKPYDIVITGCTWDLKRQFETSRVETDIPVLANTRFVMMQRGRRRRPRLENETSITVDVDQLSRASFLSAVSIVAGRASPEIEYNTQIEAMQKLRPEILPTVEAARDQGRLILVAEDNPVNRDIIWRQLGILGYACEIMNNGRQALEAWRERDYALLLADCQMPDMDGFELTSAIRKDEAQTNRHSVIIAITANAMKGEAERCLAAGMDDYLPKPININDLRDKLRHWMPQNKVGEVKDEYNPQVNNNDATQVLQTSDLSTDGSPVNKCTLETLVGADPMVFREILNEFIVSSQSITQQIKAGWEEHSAEDIRFAAHKLKSSARSVGADKLADLCLQLETAGGADNWDRINQDVPVLDKLMEDVEIYVSNL